MYVEHILSELGFEGCIGFKQVKRKEEQIVPEEQQQKQAPKKNNTCDWDGAFGEPGVLRMK